MHSRFKAVHRSRSRESFGIDDVIGHAQKAADYLHGLATANRRRASRAPAGRHLSIDRGTGATLQRGPRQRGPWRACLLSLPLSRRVQNSWKLKVNVDTTATLICFSKRVEFTDFPIEKVRFSFAAKTIMLTSGY